MTYREEVHSAIHGHAMREARREIEYASVLLGRGFVALAGNARRRFTIAMRLAQLVPMPRRILP